MGKKNDVKINFCKSCGAIPEDGSLFCSMCGTIMDGRIPCPVCNAGILEDSVFCNKCGARVNFKTAPKDADKAVSAGKTEDGGGEDGNGGDSARSGKKLLYLSAFVSLIALTSMAFIFFFPVFTYSISSDLAGLADVIEAYVKTIPQRELRYFLKLDFANAGLADQIACCAVMVNVGITGLCLFFGGLKGVAGLLFRRPKAQIRALSTAACSNAIMLAVLSALYGDPSRELTFRPDIGVLGIYIGFAAALGLSIVVNRITKPQQFKALGGLSGLIMRLGFVGVLSALVFMNIARIFLPIAGISAKELFDFKTLFSDKNQMMMLVVIVIELFKLLYCSLFLLSCFKIFRNDAAPALRKKEPRMVLISFFAVFFFAVLPKLMEYAPEVGGLAPGMGFTFVLTEAIMAGVLFAAAIFVRVKESRA